ncbi:MAG: radical SAM protein [Acidobacteria bacterium]|nr:radical SAM protein [Acidobacteriota bacterium]
MVLGLAGRMLTEPDPRALRKLVWNMGVKGVRSVQLYKRRLQRGEHFPPFLFISVISGCQLRCQGCWVDVEAPSRKIEIDELNRIVGDAKRHGNSYFGILGGEPLLHPDLFDLFAAHPDCYFQLFTNGHLIDDARAAELRRLGNVTPLVSIEGTSVVSDERRGRTAVLDKSLAGLEACTRNRLVTGVATSVCKTNIDDLVQESWLRRLIDLGVHYAWFHTYRVVGPQPTAEIALTPEEVLRVRRFVVRMRARLPIAIIDAYWDDEGQALCPMATGVSHHISPYGDIEPCPIIQFATETVHDGPSVYETMTSSSFLKDFRETAARTTRGCIVLERPDLVRELVARHGARDTTQRQTASAELAELTPRSSQYDPGNEIPEEHWAYAFAKKHWFFGFGAYS